jgi:hypothetical protein
MRRVVAALATVAFLASCGGSDDDESSAGSGGATDSFASLLGRVPDNASSRGSQIYYTNLDRIREGEPVADNGEDDVRTMLNATSFSFQLPSRYSRCFTSEECVAELGFDTRAIDVSLEFGSIPDLTEVLVGEFSAADVQRSLEASPGGDGTRVTTIDGATVLSLGTEGQADVAARSAFRPIGNAVSLGIGGPGLVSANEQAAVEAVLTLDRADSLAADPSYAAVAGALDTAKVDYALITPGVDGATWLLGGMGEVVTADDDGTTSDPAVVTYVFVFTDEASAQAGAAAFATTVETGSSLRLGIPWSEVLTVTESTVDGTVLVVTLQATNGGWWIRPLLSQDDLLDF